ncbi:MULTISPECIES: hypothetical protein [Gammaproteobacteria]|nr:MULTISPECIES: hypothetical protein [Gammaproteobacteria]
MALQQRFDIESQQAIKYHLHTPRALFRATDFNVVNRSHRL